MDLENAPDGATEDVRVEGAAPEVEQHEAQEESVTPEALAAELGWSPKDQWRGDPDEWKPASAFLRDTVSVNKAERRARKNLEDRLARIQRSTDTIIERTRAEERAKVEAEFRAAVEEGDTDRAFRASQKLASVEPAPPATEDLNDFVSRNPWFQTDPLAKQLAITTAQAYADQGKSAREQMEAAEREVRKRFPEHFEQPKRSTKGPAEVAEQQGRTARSMVSNRERGFNDLPPEAKAVAIKLEKQGVKREEYAKEYWKENA